MIAVIFEVELADGKKDAYLEIAAGLRDLLAEVPGFISVERFQSLTNPNKLLSLSTYENEEAVAHWRRMSNHRSAQSKGRDGLFTDYRIRVVSVLRDYGMTDRAQVPTDSLAAHDDKN